MEVASVSSPSCAGDNGTGFRVECSPDFLPLLKQVEPDIDKRNALWIREFIENLKVQVLEVKLQACPIGSEPISFIKHKFLTLELYSALLGHRFYVTAELNRIGAKGRINVCIDILDRKGVVEPEDRVKLCEEYAYLMSKVIAVLTDHSSCYNVFRDNCYQYADNMLIKVVKTFGIEVARSTERKATLQGALGEHRRSVLPKDVFKKRYVAVAVVGTGAAAAVVVTAGVVYWPITLVGLALAPEALGITAGTISVSPAIITGGYAMKKFYRFLKGALIFKRGVDGADSTDVECHNQGALFWNAESTWES